MLKQLLRLTLLIVWLPFLETDRALAQSAKVDELVRQVENSYLELQDLQMNFKKETRSEVFSQPEEIKGAIYLKQPDKFRLESAQEIIVTDGKFLWNYSRELRQVTKQNAQAKEKFNFLSFIEDMHSKYNAEREGSEKVQDISCTKVLLMPKERGTDFEKLILWVDGKRYLIRKMELEDLQGNVTIFWFTDIKVNPKLSRKKFEFEAGPGVELIDLTQEAKK